MSAGLADVTQHHIDVVDVRREREARALVAVLPFECAVFLLHPSPPERIREEPPPAIAERLGSQRAGRRVFAKGAWLPRAFSFLAAHHPTVTKVTGLEIDDYFGSARPRRRSSWSATTSVDPRRSARRRPPSRLATHRVQHRGFSLRFPRARVLACSALFGKTRRHTCTATAMETQ